MSWQRTGAKRNRMLNYNKSLKRIVSLSVFLVKNIAAEWNGEKGKKQAKIRKRRNQKKIPTPKPRWEKTKQTIRHLYMKTFRKPNEQLFSQ